MGGVLSAYSLSSSCPLPANWSGSLAPSGLGIGCSVRQECPFPQLVCCLAGEDSGEAKKGQGQGQSHGQGGT
ncbi:hypothetical protein CapIbe_006532 [Capra ibex]